MRERASLDSRWVDDGLFGEIPLPDGAADARDSSGVRAENLDPDPLGRGVDLDLVLTLAGHRPGPEATAPDDQRATIIALLERINLTPDRAAGLQGTLTSWLELDREERRG